MSLRKLLSIGVLVVFAAMFIYLFASNIRPAIIMIENFGSSSSLITSMLMKIYVVLFSLSGLITILFSFKKLEKEDSRKFLRILSSLVSYMLIILIFGMATGLIYGAVETNSVSTFRGNASFLGILLACSIILSVGISFKKNAIMRKAFVGVAVVMIFVFVIKQMKLIGPFFEYLKFSPESVHIYLFVLIGSAMLLGYTFVEDLLE